MKNKIVTYCAALIMALTNTSIVSYADSISSTDEGSSVITTTSADSSIAETETTTATTSIIESVLQEDGTFAAHETDISSSKEESSVSDKEVKTEADNKDDYYDMSGNAKLIKSEDVICNDEKMQFIAVTTKDGHVFYVLINYSAKEGEDNVYFLNRVDDYDLYALLYAGQGDNGEDPDFTPKQAKQAAELENRNEVKKTSPDTVSSSVEASAVEEPADSTAGTVESTPKNQKTKDKAPYIFGGAAVIIIGYFFYKNIIKKKGGKSNSSFDDSDFDDDADNDSE